MTENRNVSTTQLDQLRAGLLDDDPELKARVEDELRRDAGLAGQYGRWDEVRGQLESEREDATRLNNQLRLRRRRVLSGKAVEKPRRFTLPQMALAAATSVALTLAMVLWFNERPPEGAASVAVTDMIQDATQPVLTGNIEVDLESNVDFYVWMQGQDDVFIEAPRKGT